MVFNTESGETSYVSIYVITAIGLARTRMDEIEALRADKDAKFEKHQWEVYEQGLNKKRFGIFKSKRLTTVDAAIDEKLKFHQWLEDVKNSSDLYYVYPCKFYNEQYQVCKAIIKAASYSTVQSMWVSRHDMETLTTKVGE